MKKSRIIIPALAMIAFSVAASVTGAVAWFTAQRTVNFNAGSYTVVKTTSALEVEVTGGIGTTATGNVVSFEGRLTDGSFDHKNQKIYTPNESGSAIAAGEKGEIALASATEALLKRGTTGSGSAIKNVYTAVTFNIKFTITLGSNNDIALLMDNTASHTNFATSDNSAAKTAKGFRMAFVAQEADGKTKVLADLQEAEHCHYINDRTAVLAATEPFGGVNYATADKDLIDSAYADALPTTPQAISAYEARNDYLGFFDHNDAVDSKVSLNYKVVCWFEGTDPEIINRAAADFQTVVANLYFEAKDIAA
ncbi:MAG: hypothetical protein IKP50_04435 [Bacilli bacterium]|nr:hypothetical protein [Bacilli bacterium]